MLMLNGSYFNCKKRIKNEHKYAMVKPVSNSFMEHFSRRRLGILLAHLVSCIVHKHKRLLCFDLQAPVPKLIYQGAGIVPYLLLLKCSMIPLIFTLIVGRFVAELCCWPFT